VKIYTIGFKGRCAQNFFTTLRRAGIEKLIDVRRKNASQLAGYTKGGDLAFFLEECFGIAYEHVPEFGPPEDLLREYRKRLGKKKKDDAAWAYYVERFAAEVLSGPIVERFKVVAKGCEVVCLLCSEETAERCHRRLLAEEFARHLQEVSVEHM